MTNSSQQPRSLRTRTLGTALAMALALGGTAACSSDSDSNSGDKPTAEAGSNTDSAAESTSGSDAALPEGFPGDVPLPEFADISTIKNGADDDFWSVVLTIDPSLATSGDDLMASYGEQLEAAGFEVDEASAGNNEATNDEWTITYHSAMDGTLTVAVGSS